MKLGMEVGLGPGHTVLDGDPAPVPQKGAEPPQFSAHVCCGQTSGWIKMPLGTKVGLGPCHIVLNGDPAPPSRKRYSSPSPIFGPCLLWPRSPISATAELLFLVLAHLVVLGKWPLNRCMCYETMNPFMPKQFA